MRRFHLIFSLAVVCLMSLGQIQSAAAAVADPRMQVDVAANPDEPGQSLNELHANIRYAADLALQQLWQRIIPQQEITSLPPNGHAVRFLKRAQPTSEGVRVTFNASRVFDFLETKHIAVIGEPPTWNLQINLRNTAGQNMMQSADLLRQFAAEKAIDQGYTLQTMGASMVLQWRWLDNRQVSLSVRGTSRLGEFQETRTITPGDPLPQLQQWLLDTLLKARDAYASGGATPAAVAPLVPVQALAVDIYGNPIAGTDPYAQISQIDPYAQMPALAIPDDSILISIRHQASLPEQVLFEDDLRRDPRVASLLPSQFNRNLQQYRLQLKEPRNDQWLKQWFTQHGLTLTPMPNGWLAQ